MSVRLIRRALSTQPWRLLVPEGKALIGGTWRAGSNGQTFPGSHFSRYFKSQCRILVLFCPDPLYRFSIQSSY